MKSTAQEPAKDLDKGRKWFRKYHFKVPFNTQHLPVIATYSTGGQSNTDSNDSLTGTDGPGAGVD